MKFFAVTVPFHPLSWIRPHWQAVSLLNIRLQISVYCKWAWILKIHIFYSQKFHKTKFLSYREWRKWPFFRPCRQAALEDMHIDLLRSWTDWPVLDLTWPEVKFWNWSFKAKKYMFRTGSTRQTRWCHFYFRVSHIKEVINEKPSPWKTIIFHLVTSRAKTVDLGSNLINKYSWGMKRAIRCIFEFFLAVIHTYMYFWS